MGLNIDALRKKMEQVKENQNRGGGASFWSPKDGRNVIRILPAKEGQEFYSEAKVRYNVGPNNKMVTVPLDSNKDNCPIHAFVDALYKTKDADDEKLAKRMKASNRYYFNVIDRSIEEGKEGYGEVLVFGCGTTIFTDILGIIVDPDYGDITDPEEGYDIIITKSGKKLDTEYKTNARPKQTPIGIADWKEKLNDLQKVATPRDYAKREAILAGEDSNDSDDDDDKATTSSSSKPETKSEPNKETKKADNPKDEFDEKEADDIEAEIQAMLNKHK
jgi:hypothetical protein